MPGDSAMIRGLTPEQTLRVGYCLHVIDDERSKGLHKQVLAMDVVQRFETLQARPGSLEDVYLAEAKSNAISYAGQIANLKRMLYLDLDEAFQDNRNFERRHRGTKGLAMMTQVARRYLTQAGIIGIVFGVGYSIAHNLLPFMPPEVADNKGPTSPSIIGGAIALLAARWATLWNDERKKDIARGRYNTRCHLAWVNYLQMKIKVYRHHYSDLCEAWIRFTGKPYETASVQDQQMEDELALRQHQHQIMETISKPHIVKLKEATAGLRVWWAERRRSKANTP